MCLAITSRSRLSALLLVLWWAPAPSQAQVAGVGSADETDTSPFELTFGLERRFNDNIFTTPAPEVDSWINVETLNLLLSAEPSQHLLELEYNGEFGQFQDSGEDDYDDHELAARAYLNFGRRTALDLIGSFEKGHEDRGSGLTQGIGPGSALFPGEPDKYDLLNVRGKFGFGTDDSPGKLEIEGGYRDLEYQNHQARTQVFNRDYNFVGGAYHHRVLPKTSLVFDARATDIEYGLARPAEPGLNSTEYLYRFGITWDTTAKTRGVIKLGYLEKDFDDIGREDFSDLSWEVDIRWSPRTYSHFDLKTAREADESTSLQVDYVDREWITLAWTHEWSEAWESSLVAGYENEDFVGNVREQDQNWISLTLKYQMRYWLDWYLGARITTQDSTVDRFVFDGNVYRIGVNLTI
jgi:hypothetical protein